jgi:PAT family beta-lactamase induction signal transducer AmpG
MADRMFGPFLIDMGFEATTLTLWTSVYGMLFSMLGSGLGGFACHRFGMFRALAGSLLVRLCADCIRLMLLVSLNSDQSQAVIVAICVEHLGGGVLTTCMMAYMMSMVSSHRVLAREFVQPGCVLDPLF